MYHPQVVSGDFCECDNFSCPRYDFELCSGPDHGECVCGRCKCRPKWDLPGYDACECKAGNETCIATSGPGYGQVCSGRGECICGDCKCYENKDGQYSGVFCEDCPVSNMKLPKIVPFTR